MFKLLKYFYFLISIGLSRGIFTVLLFLIDSKYEKNITGKFSADIALISLFSFIVMLGGSVAIFREGSQNKMLAKSILNSHLLFGTILLFLLYISNTLNLLTYSIATIVFSSELIESYLRSVKKDLIMMMVSILKFSFIVFAFWKYNIEYATNILMIIGNFLILVYVISSSSFKKSNFHPIKTYSWTSLFIGIFAWIINSSDKYVASKLIDLSFLRDYSITYSFGIPIILFGSVMNLIYSREYFDNKISFNKILKKFIVSSFIASIITQISQLIIYYLLYNKFDIKHSFLINISMLLIILYGFLQLPLIKVRKMKRILTISIFSGVLNLLLNITTLHIFSWKIMYLNTLITTLFSVLLIIKYIKHEIINNGSTFFWIRKKNN